MVTGQANACVSCFLVISYVPDMLLNVSYDVPLYDYYHNELTFCESLQSVCFYPAHVETIASTLGCAARKRWFPWAYTDSGGAQSDQGLHSPL